MSKFKTTLSVEVAALLKRLPAGSAVTAVTLRKDRTGVEIEWEHDAFKTPFTFAVDCAEPECVAELADELMSRQAASSPSRPAAPAADAARTKAASRPNMKRR